jgi:enoyl-CoA hydratase/3-hydroxyacyl-CoA dehydrogenase
VQDADLVIEAVPESPEVKTAVLQELRGALKSERTILASNTSTFSISNLGDASGRPDRFVGLHFFNPPPVMKLVEVVRGGQTSDEVLARAITFAEQLGKTPVLAQRDTPGFIVNAASFALFQNLAEQGERKPETIDAAMRAFGWPMGPFELMDFIGLDVMVAMGDYFARELHPDYGPPEHLRRMVGRGTLGRKSGGGYHDWSAGRPRIEADARALPDFEPLDAILAQFNEAAKLVGAGVCSDADADLAMRLGNGVPRGPVEIGRTIPSKERESRLTTLAGRHGLAMLQPEALFPTDGKADPRMKKI